MERLTNEEIEAIRKRAEAATEGPWLLEDSYDGLWILDESDDNAIGNIGRKADAEFIAASRTDIPKLLAEIDRMDKVIDEIDREACAYDVAKEYWRLEYEHQRRQAELYIEKYKAERAEVERLQEENRTIIESIFGDSIEKSAKDLAEIIRKKEGDSG